MTIAVESPERVVDHVGRMARNSARPDVGEWLDRCLEDVEVLRRARRISEAQREALRLILLGIGMHAA